MNLHHILCAVYLRIILSYVLFAIDLKVPMRMKPVHQLLPADSNLVPVHRSPQDEPDLSPHKNKPKSPSLHHLSKITELPSTHHSPSSHVIHASHR